MKISNTEVYGLDRVFKVAKYPKAVDTEALNNEITNGIKACMMADSGSGHDNALKGIVVMADWTLSNKAWVQVERYHFLEIVSSQSTMHKAMSHEGFNGYVTDAVKLEIERLKLEYRENPCVENYLNLLYNIPSGLELTAGIVTNYQQLKTMYHQRKYHLLPEWHQICDWIRTLPHSELITQEEAE